MQRSGLPERRASELARRQAALEASPCAAVPAASAELGVWEREQERLSRCSLRATAALASTPDTPKAIQDPSGRSCTPGTKSLEDGTLAAIIQHVQSFASVGAPPTCGTPSIPYRGSTMLTGVGGSP